MEYIMGVDIGTTGTKAIAFDVNGQIVAQQSQEYEIQYPQPGHCEQDPNHLYEAVTHTIRQTALEAAKKGHTLRGISFSSAMHSLIAIEENGNLLTNCIIWADTRSKAEAEDIKKSKDGHEIYLRTGTPIHPMAPLSKLVWLRKNLPEVFVRAHKFISIKEYVFFRLFGKFLIDHSIASATGLFDICDLVWNEEALAVAGISAEKLSEPVPVTHLEKGLPEAIAKELGIDANVPFVVGASDGCLANLGSNAIGIGQATVTIGTSGAIRITTQAPIPDPKERIFNYILDEDLYVAGGPVNNGAVILNWFKDQFFGKEDQELGDKIYELLEKDAASIPAGSEGLIFLPYLLGERAPIWNANAKGVFFGVTMRHTRAHFLRAVMEGVIYGIYGVGKALEDTPPQKRISPKKGAQDVADKGESATHRLAIEVIYANGGFAKSDLWVQILADVFNKRVLVSDNVNTPSLGAAVLTMKALGMIKNIQEVKKLASPVREVLPSLENNAVYQEAFAVFTRLYDKLKDEF